MHTVDRLLDVKTCRQLTGCWMYRHADRKTNVFRPADKNVDRQTGKQSCTDSQTNGQTNIYKGAERRTDR